MIEILCAGPCRPADKGGPRRAMPGFAICDICEERCWEDLHWIADHWDDLEVMLTSPTRGPDGMPHAKSDATGIVINDAVAELRRRLADDLRYWCQVILDENPGFSGPKDDVVSFARYLARLHKRITRHHDAGLAAALPVDVHDLRREMYRRAFPSGARLYTPEPAIACVEHETSDEGERIQCEGIYRAWITDGTDGMPDLTCSVNEEHVLTPMGFKRAGRQTMKADAMMRLRDALLSGDRAS